MLACTSITISVIESNDYRLGVCTVHESPTSMMKCVLIADIAVKLELSQFARAVLVIINNNTDHNDDEVRLATLEFSPGNDGI
jgi:hypothetical protein